MAASILATLSDDWELRGNGSGTVEEYQATPARNLMDLYERLDVPCTFNLEILQQLAFLREGKDHPRLLEEAKTWQATVDEMLNRGFDVQLHAHPQWDSASYDGTNWKLSSVWDITKLSPTDQRRIIGAAADGYRKFTGQNPVAYRAGSWAAGPPSGHLLDALIEQGIRLDCSVVNGVRYKGDAVRLDYRRLESPVLPYFPQRNDLRKIGPRSPLIEIPTQSWPRPPLRQYIANRLWRTREGLLNRRPPNSFDPFGLNYGFSLPPMIMDFSAGSDVDTMIWAVGKVLDRARGLGIDGPIPLVFENHTKDLRDQAALDRVEKIVRFLKNQSDVSFETMAGLSTRIAELPIQQASR